MTDRKSFVGEFKDLLRDFIEHKQALGFKYTTISKNLRRFSIFTLNYTIENKVLYLMELLPMPGRLNVQNQPHRRRQQKEKISQ